MNITKLTLRKTKRLIPLFKTIKEVVNVKNDYGVTRSGLRIGIGEVITTNAKVIYCKAF